MSVPTPRTVDDVDRELDRQRWLLDRAVQRLTPESAELALARIDQLLDERLDLAAAAR